MTKEDYLRKKGMLPSEDFGNIYTFTSTHAGVGEIREHMIWEKSLSGRGQSSEYVDGRWAESDKYNLCKYRVQEDPWEIEIKEGEENEVSENVGMGTGFGDLWSWTVFSSMDRSALETAREAEAARIREKYA
jgi:hypothetical protein